ncbi:MAG: radical SAM protein, partial [Rhodospirillales bacterium]
MGIQSVISGQTAGQSNFDFSGAAAPRARGRGATTSPASRYSTERRNFVDDGWYQAPWRTDETDDALPADERRVPTELLVDTSRTIIARNKSPDIPFDRSINPYKGCEHGCTYCFARPTHAFLDMSPGLDFETRIFHKPNAAALLADELHKPGYRCDVIAMGTNTDPYQPVERDAGITRAILEVLRDHNHPVSIVTKSDLVLRDLDILGPMAARGQAKVMLSVTT